MALNINSTVSDRAATTCQTLQLQKIGIVTTAQDTGYKAEQDRLWSRTCWLPAACYVRPQDIAEVAAVFEALAKTNTKSAVRSTGHHPNTNFSSVDGSGVVIDLRDVKSLSLDQYGTLHAGG
ncbi:hypothetical protein PG989_010628 [Apiospora arundinis]|uniref:FAD-binding domain-containing protein n=1 Tax=Apiospora arundinis TaxID=335852 RepID=A0ABR2HNW5_9PEZI